MLLKDFKEYLTITNEFGYVDQLKHSICLVSGLPNVTADEVVMFENGELGKVLSLSRDYAEVLLLSNSSLPIGSRVVRTESMLTAPVGKELLGRIINPLGKPMDGKHAIKSEVERPVDVLPPGIMMRKPIEKPLPTGVPMVDVIVPLAKGQRQLIIGDRKTGKTQFLLQTIVTQASQGTICIYAVIGQRQIEIKRLFENFQALGLTSKTILVATSSSDPAGLIFMTPYTAMTVAEYFRDEGFDVLLILDDVTSHARYYREISLLAKRFPGRSSYPGDIFYVQARLMERAGNFNKGSITCFPSAESVYGDISGYIQTNVMSMTDGHIFFDIELYNQGQRPAVSPFLSVTRVGHQAQTPLLRELSSKVTSFMVEYDKVKQFLHFGAEIGESARNVLDQGKKLMMIFDQSTSATVPISITTIAIGALWAGIWKEVPDQTMRLELNKLLKKYQEDDAYKKKLDTLLASQTKFGDFITILREQDDLVR